MRILPKDDPLVVDLVDAIQFGRLERLEHLLEEHSDVATLRIEDEKGQSRTMLHIATDWPGHFPNGPAIVASLIEAGADPKAPMLGAWHAETPLHWAASTDDVEVLDALIDAGADIEAQGGSIAGGTPLDDAVGYGCWQVARRLVECGARVDQLWHAAALGITSRLEELFQTNPPPTPDDVNQAFWQACHGGQRRAAEYLLARGADMNWIPSYHKGTALDIAATLDTRHGIVVVAWLQEQGARSAGR